MPVTRLSGKNSGEFREFGRVERVESTRGDSVVMKDVYRPDKFCQDGDQVMGVASRSDVNANVQLAGVDVKLPTVLRIHFPPPPVFPNHPRHPSERL